MITQEDRHILREVGRKYILDIAFDSQLLKDKLTFKEHVRICNFVKNLSYEDVIGLTITEDIKEFESKFKKFLKYSFAAIVGVAMPGIGPALGMFVLYIFRKMTDTCSRACLNKFPMSNARKICRYECQVNATRQITDDLRREITKCRSFENAAKCEKKLQKEYIKWSKRLQVQIVKLQQAKLKVNEKERQRNQKTLLKKAKNIAAGFNLKKSDLMDVITEDKQFRKQTPFREHLKVYKTVSLMEDDGGLAVKPPKINPKNEKRMRAALYLGLWAVPIPFFNDAVNYMMKKHNFACYGKCAAQRKYSQSLCRNQCSYLSAKYAVQMINKQMPKCSKADKPTKCKSKLLTLLSDWKQREVEAKIKFEAVYRRDIAAAKKKEVKV